MSKELEAFNRVSESLLHAVGGIGNAHYIGYSNSVEPAKEDLDIIETVLKDYDNIKLICNYYDIEFNLRNIREAIFTFAQLKGEHGANLNNYNRKLKILEIIKEKRVNVRLFVECKTRKEYNNEVRDLYYQRLCLNQVEYDLLKEVLL